jgi:cell division protein FtsZ
MGDEVRVTVIAAGFDRWDGTPGAAPSDEQAAAPPRRTTGLIDTDAEMAAAGLSFGDEDDFDVPPFLK